MLLIKDLEPRLRTVACFYQVWVALAESNSSRAEQAFRDWQEALKTLRKSGTPVGWIFGAAARALQNEAEPFTASSRNLLTAMMHATEDDKAPVPASFHL